MADAVQVKYALRLRQVLDEMVEGCDDLVAEWGVDAVQIAQRLAPKDTGDYAGTIHVEDADTLPLVRGKVLVSGFGGGERDRQAATLEFGNSKRAASPHMVPAVVMARRNAIKRAGVEGLVGRM